MNKRFLARLLQKFLSVTVVFFAALFVFAQPASAADDCSVTYGTTIVSGDVNNKSIESGSPPFTFAVTGTTITNGDVFDLYLDKTGVGNGIILDTQTVANDKLTLTVGHDDALKGEGAISLALQKKGGAWCNNLTSYSLTESVSCTITLTQNGVDDPSCYDTDSGDITIKTSNIKKGLVTSYSGIEFFISFGNNIVFQNFKATNGEYTTTYSPAVGQRKIFVARGDAIQIYLNPSSSYKQACARDFNVAQGKCNSVVPTVPTTPGTPGAMTERKFELCTQVTNDALKAKCDKCYGKQGVWTAVGCIEHSPQSIVKRFLEIGLGVGGAICLLMCLSAGFILTTSQGEPAKVGEAREMITSAIIGLLFIIFSVFMLQFIGVTIFNIPGFGGAPPTTP